MKWQAENVSPSRPPVRGSSKRTRLQKALVVAVVFCHFSGGFSDAQTIVGAPPRLNASSVGRFFLNPTVRVGYQKIGMDFSMAEVTISQEGAGPMTLRGVDFKLTGSNVWVGSIGAELALFPQLTLFACGEACFWPNIKAETQPDIVFGSGSPMAGRSVTWTDPEFGHWIIDGGLCFMGPPWYGVVIGLRSDQLSLKLKAPGIQGFEPEEGETLGSYRSDFQSKILLPYAGIQVFSANSRAIFIGSRYFSSEITIPFRLNSDVEGGLTQTENTFSLKGTNGLFVEGLFDYRMRVASWLSLGVWGRGNAMTIKDNANHSLVESGAAGTEKQSAEQTASYNRYMYGGGVSASIRF